MLNRTRETEFLSGGGEMGERIRNFDWTKTPLGPAENWPRSLKTCVRIMLTSQQPIWIGWGPELIKLYNDAYKSIVGGKHPGALGKPASVVWKDIWSDIEPMLSKVMNQNEGTYTESQLLVMERYGYKEETYYTFSYSPVPGDNGQTEGMICYNTSETERVLNERALKTLREVSNSMNDCKTTHEVFERCALALSNNLYDFPFTSFYELKDITAGLLSKSGINTVHPLFPQTINLDDNPTIWNLALSIESGSPLLIENFQGYSVPLGNWSEPTSKAVLFPMFTNTDKKPTHFFIAGLNPYRIYDEPFEAFIKLICEQVSQAFNTVQAFEAEKKRALALEELDRSKTVFFSNISHEFRTPITLMLGPLEELLKKGNSHLSTEEQENLKTTHRNAMRLLKLVNGLLDFSKVESGRMEARFMLTDISLLTKRLASNFQSLMEKGGLKFTVHTTDIGKSVYLDRSMWEKIIFNLLSNAFKYTLKGEVSISVFSSKEQVIVQVKDTGPGIPPHELPKMFERFHRVESITGRTHEGTGIGLSMVKELVHLHGGAIRVESEEGIGSIFTVTIPFGKEHLANEKIVDHTADFSEVVSEPFLLEAESLIQPEKKGMESAAPSDRERLKILIADDNTDMRNYIFSLLKSSYTVVTAVNGQDALQKIKEHQPALVLSDIMMPIMDGIQLTKELKKDTNTATIPVILITARAGEESKLEGFEIGADDYLVKPFSARELVSRVAAHIQMAAVRKKAQEATEAERHRLFQVFMQAPAIIAVLKGPSHIFELANPQYMSLVGSKRDIVGKTIIEALPEIANQGFPELLDKVYATGKPYIGSEILVELDKNSDGVLEKGYLNFVYQPYFNEKNEVAGIIVHAVEVTAQVLARKKIEDSENLFRSMAESLPQMIWVRSADGVIEYASKDWEEYSGIKNISEAWLAMMHPEDGKRIMQSWSEHQMEGTKFSYEVRLKNKDGHYRWHQAIGQPLTDENNKIVRWIGAISDIHTQKTFTEKLEEEVIERTRELKRSNEDLQQFAHVASHDLKEPVRKIKIFLNILQSEHTKMMDQKGLLYMDKIQSAAERIKAMIDGVLKYSTVDSLEEEFQKVNLNEVIENVQKDLEIIIHTKGATITYDTLPEVKGISLLIYQLFYNLINNSLKFSKPDQPPKIEIKGNLIQKNDITYAQLIVTDNGIGFEPDNSEAIFGAFKRMHSKDDYEGTGLGLALCKKIVERHNGEISASGMLNKGAEFYILLPKN